jgi:hypothetical protein
MKKKLFSGALKKKGQEFRDNYYSYSFPPEGGGKEQLFSWRLPPRKKGREYSIYLI